MDEGEIRLSRRPIDYHMRWKQVVIEGFPFVARLRLTNVRFGETQPLPYDVAAPLAIIEMAPWIGSDMRVAMPQGARLRVPSLSAGFETDLIESPPISADVSPL